MTKLTDEMYYSIIGNVTLDREPNLRNIRRHATTTILIEID